MKANKIALAASALSLATSAAAAQPPWRVIPTAGVHAYRYDVREISPLATKGYRTDFRVRADGKGGAVAEIVSSASFDGKDFTPVALDPDCAKALHARPGLLATVRLYPLTPEQTALGETFLPMCAPAGLFFPLTDILNVALVQSTARFHAADLKSVGQSAEYPGFSTSLDRAGVGMQETSAGGSTTAVALEGGQLTLDWKPAIADLHLVERPNGQTERLDGTEHFAFRLIIDARSGWLQRADALYDDLDLTVAVPSLPADKQPKFTVKRTVSIVRTDG